MLAVKSFFASFFAINHDELVEKSQVYDHQISDCGVLYYMFDM